MIHPRRLALLACCAVLVAAGPASAEGTWLERLFTRNPPAPAPAAAPAPAPAKPAPPKPAPQAKAPEAAPAAQTVAAPAPVAAKPAAAAATQPATAAQTAAPKPSAQPVAVAPGGAVPSPATTAAISPAAPPPPPLSERAIVERANAYFNGLSTLVGDFVQVGGDGRKLAGKIYLQRPGKLRFEYAAPATLEVIADGSSVAVRDRKLATQDLFSIGQTPLKFLLRDRIDLAKDMTVTEVGSDADGVRVVMEDRSTLGGTSKIALFFDGKVETLTRWRIIDPQGFLTTVTLANLDRSRRMDANLFVISYERVLGGNGSGGP